jgi:hypothetical protein
MRKRLFSILAIIMITALSFGSLTALAQYETQETANFTISSDGTIHIGQSSTVGNVEIDIVGSPGATGSVSTVVYTANPQPDASKPSNVVLSHFVVVTFNMDASDFQNATITIHYSDADVAGMTQPYVLYKYNPDTNAYVELDAVVDTTAKTITAVLTSTTDPLFAIGGIAVSPTATPTASPTQAPENPISLSIWAWIFVIIEAITGFILVIVVYLRTRR